MALYAAIQDGNWSNTATWNTVTNTPTTTTGNGVYVTATHYTAAFTAPNTTNACVGVIFPVIAVGSSTYTYTVTLQENTVDTAATIAVAGTSLDTVGNYFVKFTTPYVFTSTTAGYYRFKVVRSGSGSNVMRTVADSGGTNMAFEAIDDRNPAAAPTTGDDIQIVGANGSGTVAVTVDGTQYVGSGTGVTLTYGRLDCAITVGLGGLLKWDTAASATLTCKGHLFVSGRLANKAELQMGTVANPYPAAYVAKLIFDNYGTAGKAGLGSLVNGRVQLHGYSATGTTNWKTTYASGAGSVADPMVVTDAVNWTTGDEIVVCTSAAFVANGAARHNNEVCDVTKVNTTTYSLVSKRDIDNDGFEGAVAAGWTQNAGTGSRAIDTATFHSGKQSMKITAGASADTYIYQDIYTNPGKSVTLKFWTRGDGTYAGRYKIYNQTGSADIVALKSTGVTSTTWTEVTETFTVPANCVQVRISLYCPSTNTGVAYFDDVTATVDGLMYSHTAGVHVLHLTRNVIIEAVGNTEGWGLSTQTTYSNQSSNISGDLDYDWARFNYNFSPVIGNYYAVGVGNYCASDYNVFFRGAGYAFSYLYHIEYPMATESFVGNIAYNSGGYNIAHINKTLTDCFAVYCAYGFTVSVGSVTLVRCKAYSSNRGSSTALGTFALIGTAISLTDCASYSGGARSIYFGGSCSGRILRFISAYNNATYAGDIQTGRASNNISLEDCTFQYAFPTNQNLALNPLDSEWRITNFNLTANTDFVITPVGYRYRTGTGLTDTTVHTAGGFADRFESTSSVSPLTWTFNTPTGNIQNKPMMVGVWCNINSATYYAGTHQLPRLTINYDNGTTAYCQAAQSTGWQFLTVPFTPLTTYGQITITLSTMTDATTTNAYVYFDDFSVLYPAGYKLDLGAMDIWADGNPVTPPIATVLSALDVWSASTVTEYGASTMGETLKDVTPAPSASTVADAVWDETASTHTTAGTTGKKMNDLKNASLLIDNEIIV